MVEANFWSPQLHVHFAAANQIGLAEALTTIGPIRNFGGPICGENLWLVPSGFVKPSFYPSIERYRERFAELRAAFDFVLISAPGLSREPEATSIGQLADGVVLIVEANHSRRETVRRAKEQLECAGVRLLGAVLDQRTFPIPESLYRRL
jgi:Mrp family chromosome partitioning ATPase